MAVCTCSPRPARPRPGGGPGALPAAARAVSPEAPACTQPRARRLVCPPPESDSPGHPPALPQPAPLSCHPDVHLQVGVETPRPLLTCTMGDVPFPAPPARVAAPLLRRSSLRGIRMPGGPGKNAGSPALPPGLLLTRPRGACEMPPPCKPPRRRRGHGVFRTHWKTKGCAWQTLQ